MPHDLNLQQSNAVGKIIAAVEAGRTASVDTQFGEVHVRRSRFFERTRKYCAELVRGEFDVLAAHYAGTITDAVYGLGDKLRERETAEECYGRLVRNAAVPKFITVNEEKSK